MAADKAVLLEDPDLIGHAVDLDPPSTGGVGDRVIITADAHHALGADPTVPLENSAKRNERQHEQRRLFLGERVVQDLAGCRMQKGVGDVA